MVVWDFFHQQYHVVSVEHSETTSKYDQYFLRKSKRVNKKHLPPQGFRLTNLQQNISETTHLKNINSSNWIISPDRVKTKKMKPPPNNHYRTNQRSIEQSLHLQLFDSLVCPTVDGSEIRRTSWQIVYATIYLPRILYLPGGAPPNIKPLDS